MPRLTLVFCAVLVLFPGCGSSGGGTASTSGFEALTFTITRVARTGDVLSVGSFDSTGFTEDPAIGAGGAVASEVDVGGAPGFLIYDGTTFHLHAVEGTPRPDGGTWGSSAEHAVISEGFTSFETSRDGGIYMVPTDGSGPVVSLVDSTMVVPDAAGNPLTGNPTFTGFGEHGRSGTLMLFVGTRTDNGDIDGLYLNDNGAISLVVEEGDTLPLLGGTIENVDEPHVRGTHWSATIRTSSNHGIIGNFGGPLEVIADTTTPVPSGLGMFDGFNESSIEGNLIVFQGHNSSGNGVYLYDRGTMTYRTIADQTVVAPGSGNLFNSASDPSIAGDYIVFQGFDPLRGIFAFNVRDGGLHRVVGNGDIVDGKTVDGINKRDSYMVADNRIGLGLTFTDNSNGIYIVEIGAP